MAADKTTTTSHMRTLQFNDKVAALNREFIKQLQKWSEQCPHYDFSDSIRSYLDHMDRLDKMYSAPGSSILNGGKSAMNTPGSGRVIAKAKRRTDGGGADSMNSSVKISTPAAAGAPPRFSVGNVSAITVDNTLVESPSMGTGNGIKPSSEAPTPAGPRKRAIRGGGPLGGSESVVFKGTDGGPTAPEVPKNLPKMPSINLPKPTPGFWTKKSEDKSGDQQSSGFAAFSFGKKVEDSEAKKDGEKKTASPLPTFSITPAANDTDKKEKNDDKPSSGFPSMFGKGGLSTFPSFGAKKDDDKPAATLSFPVFGSSSEKKDDGKLPSGGLFPTFGSATAAPSLSGFSFGSLPTSTAAVPGANGADDDNAEYVPPKADIVENSEPGASFSTKCSVFKKAGTEFTKLGVGMLHLKEIEGVKSILVRAATTTGTVWLNALINKSMMASKADEKGEKIRLMCPITSSEMGNYVIRFANAATAEKILTHIDDNKA